MLTVLRQRNFGLLWTGGLVSMIGDWVLITALPFYLYERTGSALAVSGFLIASLIPSVALGSIAGVFVDRWNRQRIMVIADLSRAALLLLLLLLIQGGDRLWLIYAVTFCQSALSRFFGPAENALLPTLVGEADLVPANSLNVLNNNVARLAGPPIGGAIYGLFGLQGVLLLNGASYLVSGLLIALIALPHTPVAFVRAETTTAWGAVWRDWLAGLRLIVHQSCSQASLSLAASPCSLTA